MSLEPLYKGILTRLGERHGFAHSVGTLMGGTVVAQALAVLSLPILTRLYTAADFSVFAVYAALLGILSVVACMRLEIAIPLPERDDDAASLLVLAICSSTAFATLLGLLVLLLPEWIGSQLGVPAIEPYLWMVPLGIWFASSYSAVQYWGTRKKNFVNIARTRVVQAVAGVGTQVGTGLSGAGPFGLLFGHMISSGAGLFALARAPWREEQSALRSVSGTSMRAMLREYWRFPKYSTLEALANGLGTQAPVIVIAALATGPEAGYLVLAMRVLATPIGLIGGAVAQVFLSRAPNEYRRGHLGEFASTVLGGLFGTGVGPLLFAGITAAPAFAIIFGEDWRRAGELVSWMTPWFILQFISSPVSMVVYVTGNQKTMLGLTLFGLIMRLAPVALASLINRAILPEVYAVASALFYALCTLIFYRLSGVGIYEFFGSMKGASKALFWWSVAGVALFLVFSSLSSA